MWRCGLGDPHPPPPHPPGSVTPQESLETAVQYTAMAQNLREKGLISRAIRRDAETEVYLAREAPVCFGALVWW